MTINREFFSLQTEIHELAHWKGWWDKPRSPLEIHALIHSEISEATEAARTGHDANERMELADAVIRVMDYFGYKGWDLHKEIMKKHELNKLRPHRHGNKKY